MKHKKLAALILSCAFALSGCGGAGRQDKEQTQETQSADAAGDTEAWQKAEESPYAAYPELVTYTLGQMSGVNNSNLPDGDTYEDNVYTRYLRKMLNIQNDNAYMEREDRYDEFINILVKDQTLPDVLVVSDRETLKELVENDLVEDLSDVYESCTTTRIKEMFESYGSDLLDAGKFNGKLMAIPETVIDHGPRLLWLRKDWMDELGLDEPKTLDDAFEIIEAFVENGMGTEEGEDPVGLVCDTDLVGSTSSSYSVEPVFDRYHASPQRWVNQNGEIETLIFDEIDTGISGRTAQKVSEKMALIGRCHQVLCITHLPQIAAMADTHFEIEKHQKDNETITEIHPLEGDDSVRELARLLGGAELTQAVFDNAKEMKELAQVHKNTRLK